MAASEPGSSVSALAASEDISPTVKQNLGTEGSIVEDVEVHQSIEVNAKMAQTTPMTQMGMSTAYIETPMAQVEVPQSQYKCTASNDAHFVG